MLIYRLGIAFIFALIINNVEAGIKFVDNAAANDESIFDFADSADESRENSPFDYINSSAKPSLDQDVYGYYNSAKIIAINKITAKSRQITAEIGKSSYFDNIEIKLFKCWKSSDPYIPNNQLLLSIIESKFDEDSKTIFEGWLISSEPALSTFEHPVYEVLAADCMGLKVK